jgi:hypothetical protein
VETSGVVGSPERQQVRMSVHRLVLLIGLVPVALSEI